MTLPSSSRQGPQPPAETEGVGPVARPESLLVALHVVMSACPLKLNLFLSNRRTPAAIITFYKEIPGDFQASGEFFGNILGQFQ